MTILIIGNKGYIGSRLVEYLHDEIEKIDTLDGVDVDSVQDVTGYNTIIYLAAHSGVKKCADDPHGALVNNVSKFINFTKLLNNDQKFIYTSSASVYGNTQGKLVTETEPLTYPYNVYDFTKQVVDEYMSKTEYNYYALRLGTVNGSSPHPRHDLMINSMVKSAQDNHCIHVRDDHLNRAMLDIKDLCRLVYTIITSDIRMPGVYNVSSFNATVKDMANYISQELNTVILPQSQSVKSCYDFCMDTTRVQKVFNFSFQGSLKTIVDSLAPPKIKLEPLVKCKVCNQNTVEILDFGQQPLVHCSHTCETYPLVLDFCTSCTFIQSRYILENTYPMSDDKYIQWLCNYLDRLHVYGDKTILETSTRVIVDGLCNDHGWSCDIKDPSLIVSLNTIAYVSDVHKYIRELAMHMSDTTKLVLQIPYIDSFRDGVFDTIYHGHVNYFKLKSIKHLLQLYGLFVTRLEKTTVHDNSYLLVVKRNANTEQYMIPNETELKLDDCVKLATKFRLFKLNLQEYISSYKDSGYLVIGYGASCKGNSIINLTGLELDYIIDDDASKRGLYVNQVQVLPITRILKDVDKKMVIIPFTRKHFDHIHQKITDITLPTTDIVFIKLFPTITMVSRDLHAIPKNIKTTVIMHFYNEEYLLPYWLNHHKNMFDHGILINYNSDDKSVNIIQNIVPNWTLVNTTNPNFDLRECDKEVMDIEKTIKGWKIALNVTEFLCCDNLHHLVEKYEDKNNSISFFCIPMVESKQFESDAPLDIYQPLVKQRTFGLNKLFRKSRFIHCAPHGQYGTGRHDSHITPNISVPLYEATVLWYGFSPFNETILTRKLQIQNKMTAFDKEKGNGREHITTREKLIEQFDEFQNQLINLKEYTETSHFFKKTYLCW